MEWEDGETIEEEDVQEKTNDILKLIEKRIELIWRNGDVDDIGRLSFYKEVKEMLK